MAGNDDDVQRFAYDNAVFHDIIQHYDDTARGNHDDIDYEPAGIDDLDGSEYDDNGDIVATIGIIGSVLHDIAEAIEHFGSFADIPDNYDFGFATDEADTDDTCDFVFFFNYGRIYPPCDRNKPYVAPGDDDDDPGPEAA